MTLLEAPRLPNFPADLTQSRETREPATALPLLSSFPSLRFLLLLSYYRCNN